jgi:hypothetical protein
MSMKFGNFGNLYTPPSQRAAQQRTEPSHYGSGGRGPVWQTLDDLLIVLAQYRKWYDEGRSDTEISALIKAKYVIPHNPQSQFRRGKR